VAMETTVDFDLKVVLFIIRVYGNYCWFWFKGCSI